MSAKISNLLYIQDYLRTMMDFVTLNFGILKAKRLCNEKRMSSFLALYLSGMK